MEALATYLIKSSVWLTGFALIYFIFLRNERFFVLNRIFLITGICASLFFPFFTWHYTVIQAALPTEIAFSEPQQFSKTIIAATNNPESFSVLQILLLIYSLTAFYLIARIFRQTLPVFRLIENSETDKFGSAKLIRTDKYPASFSFFSFVFVNPSISDTETNEIMNHELEHIRQKHWIDLLMFEILRTVQWFNPIVWLYGHLIRQNHEYLADERALQRTANPAIYRAALLNQMFGGPVISLANSFNYSLNKKRFNMMKKITYSPIRKFKLLLVLPLVATVFYAFATPEYKFVQTEGNNTNAIGLQEEKTVKGKVVNEEGKPLKGATIIVSGTTIGTISDADGNFKIQMTDNTPLAFSYVGYDYKKVNPDFEKEMVITMKTGTIGIGMVEIYPSTAKKATSTIATGAKPNKNQNKKQKEEVILENKGEYYFDGVQPLIVKDGVISPELKMKDIDSNTIKSINVLKDKMAITKYGIKGKNGVLEITTKEAASNFIVVEQMPEFPEGAKALKTFIEKMINYPEIALKNGITGRVFVAFVVNKDGGISNAKVSRSVDPSLDKEALRVVNSMPKWIPGKQNGEAVDVTYELPINFNLPPEKISKEKLH